VRQIVGWQSSPVKACQCHGGDISCVTAANDNTALTAYGSWRTGGSSDEGETMTDPKEPQREQDEPDELEVDAETVKDLEADADSAEAARGGAAYCVPLGTCRLVT
jgi:hypothetical protein